ncbi:MULTISPECIES: protein phosphatase CheZ [Alishewanella]|jgi:chemotaxis protein CheZ|uniref:Protein phosphatase CheZ n=1 Tax=Alishewanella aestuarii B11 TaxID=1197174 RepID=J1PZH8_9ALTE|nr:MULTISPECIES: protein phosphatase CheZ [Alishewanella]EJI84148.1 chemotaxis phosphatase, CheZ [Alishewanella aestuarii B11]MCT8125562.1 protein phosphatase CheZ [Alishewanella sp. BS5-314]OCW98159.1 protein phosphatase [Alishewanella sp. HH-ZS]
MSANSAPLITLDQARELVQLLEMGEQDIANQLVQQLGMPGSSELFAEVGKLTRQLHESLKNFQIDPSLNNILVEDIPDAKKRLNHVIDMTEQAANRTMDAVESCLPIADQISQQLNQLLPRWQKLMKRDLELGEFKTLCHGIDAFLAETVTESNRLNQLLTDVLMAQDYQDLTGQILRRVIELVREVEESLIGLLTAFGNSNVQVMEPKAAKRKIEANEAEGPIIDKEGRNDVVSGQDDVDDLLSSLGF